MMVIHIVSADETEVERLEGSSLIYKDKTRIIILVDINFLSDEQKAMLETDGIYVALLETDGIHVPLNLFQKMIKVKSHFILHNSIVKALTDNQWLVEFEI